MKQALIKVIFAKTHLDTAQVTGHDMAEGL